MTTLNPEDPTTLEDRIMDVLTHARAVGFSKEQIVAALEIVSHIVSEED